MKKHLAVLILLAFSFVFVQISFSGSLEDIRRKVGRADKGDSKVDEAAAKGTILWVFTDRERMLMAVEPESGRNEPKAECITLDQLDNKRQLVVAGTWSENCGATQATPNQFLTFANPATAGANLGGAVSAPSVGIVLALINASGDQGSGPSVGVSPVSTAPPSSFGVNLGVFCASAPCN